MFLFNSNLRFIKSFYNYLPYVSKIFKALSDETRLKILKILENGEVCVCEIVSVLNMDQPRVSFHLSILKDAGLIKSRREGNRVFYSIDDSDLFKRFLILSILEDLPVFMFQAKD